MQMIFDCSALPPDFISESGFAAFEEHEATRRPFKLPYEFCYFEFRMDLREHMARAPELGRLAGIGFNNIIVGVLAREEFHLNEEVPVVEYLPIVEHPENKKWLVGRLQRLWPWPLRQLGRNG